MSPTVLPPRMASKVTVEWDCWTWTGALTSRGYSCLDVGGKRVLGHRHVYELLVGPIPDGLTIDHLCRNKRCINPAHLEPVTQAVNNARKPPRDTCAKGHRMEGVNLRIKVRANGRTQRECRACQIEWTRASYQRLTNRKLRSDRVDTDAFLAGKTVAA